MGAEVPFAQALTPWLERARRQYADAVPGHARVLTPSALAGLLDGLAQELAFVSAPTLLELFLEYPERRWFTPRSSVAHGRFVADLLAGGLERVLTERPELARLIDQVVDGWCDRIGRMAERIASDRRLLETRFAARLPFDRAVQVVDTAVELGGAAGARVVYKDRPVGMDAAFAELLRWVNACQPSHDLLTPDTIDCGAFGWVAYVAQVPADDPGARQAYLTRAGMLLCLVHALGGGDIHAGNVRVCGQHPVIIDGEVLLRPRRASEQGDATSVLTTGWLPTAQEVARCGLAAEPHAARPQRWQDVGTDAIRRRPLRSPLGDTRPEVVACFRHEPGQTVERLCAGFQEIYALIMARGLPLDVFAASAPRVLLRTSYLYQEAIERSLQPEALVAAAARAEAIDGLADGVPRVTGAAAEAVAAAERSSMRQLQVPRFTAPATGRQLFWQGELLGEPFRRSPLQRAARLIAGMSRSAMAAHCRDIADAVAAAADGSLQANILQLESLAEFA